MVETSNTKVTTVGEMLEKSATVELSAHMVFPGQRCTLLQLASRADAYAELVIRAGLEPGDKVGVWLPPSLDMVAAIFGVVRVGCVAVPISDRFRASELAHLIPHADLTLFLTTMDDDFVDRLGVLTQALPNLVGADLQDLTLPEAPVLRSIALSENVHTTVSKPLPRRPVNDLALLMYTSGTSAAPKACQISHTGLLAQARALADDRYLLTGSSVVWSPLPLFHIAGLVSMLAAVFAGASFVHSGTFEPIQTLRLIEQEKVTHALAAFETIWMQLLDHRDANQSDLSSLTTALSSNGEAQMRQLQMRLPGVAFVANYGSTEGTGHVSMGRADEPLDTRLAAGGLPMPGTEVRIIDPSAGIAAASGTLGEIQFRGVSLFTGYFKDASATREAIIEGGWFRSGDLGVMDDAGRLYFKGRLKDMLKVGGENVAALEVESYLVRHPAVNVAAVVGVPDDYYGEVPAAFVELAAGARLTSDELIQFCLGRIATYKVPRYVRIIDRWPMSGTKIKKAELRESLESELRIAGTTVAPRLKTTSARPK